jgi:ParB family chromosome partitioning protein
MQLKLFNEVKRNQYSVRKVEELVQMLKNGEDVQTAKKKITGAKAELPQEFNDYQQRLADMLNTKVTMTCTPKGKGKISIPFANEEELEHIVAMLDTLRK